MLHAWRVAKPTSSVMSARLLQPRQTRVLLESLVFDDQRPYRKESPAVEGISRCPCQIWRVGKEWSDPSKFHSKLQHAVTVLWLCFEIKLHAEGSWMALWEARAITAILISVLWAALNCCDLLWAFLRSDHSLATRHIWPSLTRPRLRRGGRGTREHAWDWRAAPAPCLVVLEIFSTAGRIKIEKSLTITDMRKVFRLLRYVFSRTDRALWTDIVETVLCRLKACCTPTRVRDATYTGRGVHQHPHDDTNRCASPAPQTSNAPPPTRTLKRGGPTLAPQDASERYSSRLSPKVDLPAMSPQSGRPPTGRTTPVAPPKCCSPWVVLVSQRRAAVATALSAGRPALLRRR